MKLKLISDFATLEENAENWDQVAGDFPFFRFAWMGSWIKHLGKSCELAVLVAVDDDGEWIGIAPWCIDQHKMTKRLRWISSGAACADYLNLIARPDHESSFALAASDWLAANFGSESPLGRIDSIELEGISLSQPATAHFVELLSASGFKQHQTELEGCWTVQLPPEWSELEPRFSKSMRRKTKKATKRLGEEATVIRSSNEVDFEELWATFVELHQQRRQMLGQAGCFADSSFQSFLREAMKDLIESGHAEIVEIQHDGQPLASMLLLNDGQTVHMYQSGMCDQRAALEPGYQMAACAIQRAILSGFRAFDFLRGDEPYKARWNTTRVPLSRIKFIPRTFSAQLKHSLWLTGRSFKEHVLTAE